MIREEEKGGICRRIRETALAQMESGVDTFLVGGARGFDMIAAEVLLELREREGKKLRLVSVLPFPSWRDKWPKEEYSRQEKILRGSDDILFSAETYSRMAYLDRDRRMVDESSVCIAYCTHWTGGTAYTVRYALQQGKTVLNLAVRDGNRAGQ
jgi:uncharacterized phage-like protein YoqJ